MVRVSLVSLYSAATDGCDLVEDEAAPDVLLLNVVESLVALGHEVVDGHDVARLAVLSPVACQLQLGHFGVGVPPVPVHSDDEGHVSAPLPEETQTLEVRLDDGARPRCKAELVERGTHLTAAPGRWAGTRQW